VEKQEAKRYEILASLPAYGPMYIPVTENGDDFYSQGLAVRFHREDGPSWVANFRPGWTALHEVHELSDSSHLLVIAGGTCYLMNPEKTKPLSIFGAAITGSFRLANGRLVLQSDIDLLIVETDGTHWHSDRISWDGLKELTVSDNSISGFSVDPATGDDEVTFSYNTDTRKLTGGSYQLYQMNSTMNKAKPWWKFW
jgi:hypothetical protein